MRTRPTPAEVRARYWPSPDPRWSVDTEAAFFADLDLRCPPSRQGCNSDYGTTPLCPVKAMLLRSYAQETLKAQRLRGCYLDSLGRVLGDIAESELSNTECQISQRNEWLGTRKTLRTIQAQLEAAEVLTRCWRAQGHGHVGDVLLYKPAGPRSSRTPPSIEIERLYRAAEGEATWCGSAVLLPSEVPY